MPPSAEDRKKASEQYDVQLKALAAVFEDKIDEGNTVLPWLDIREFELLNIIGTGGFSKVYVVQKEDRKTAVKVQIKISLYPWGIDNVLREKNYLVAMESIFIVNVLGKYRDALNIYLYMPITKYGDLRRLMSHVGEQKKKFDEDMTNRWVSQIVCALEYVHACNVIYRDLKPGNCLIFAGGRLKLGDFGLAIHTDDYPNELIGTHHYCAPEMFEGADYTGAVDWWALGVCIYEMLFDKRPFSETRDTKEQVGIKVKQPLEGLDGANLSEDVKDLIQQLLEKDPLKRIGTKSGGVHEIKKHSWFVLRTDFYDLVMDDVLDDEVGILPWDGLELQESEKNMFKQADQEDKDCNKEHWEYY